MFIRKGKHDFLLKDGKGGVQCARDLYPMVVEGDKVVRAGFEPIALVVHNLPLQVAKQGHLYTGKKRAVKVESSASDSAKYRRLSPINYSNCICDSCIASSANVIE